MPRVTDAYRRARRDEIAHAAVRVLARNGVANTSIAQIVEESGLSAGAIYANFENKAQLARYVADKMLVWRIDEVEAALEPDEVHPPIAVLRVLLRTLDEEAPPLPVLLQFWGEATIDPELHAVLHGKIGELRDGFERTVHRWAAERSPEDPDGLAARTAEAMIALCQGYLANAGLFGWMSPEEYLERVSGLLAG
jgi:AcrR family transcriptional regulator